MRARSLWIAAAVAALLTFAATSAFAAGIADIPGVPLPAAQPVTGSLEATPSFTFPEDNVYSTNLSAGKWFWAFLEAPSSTDFDLCLYGPGKLTVLDSVPALAWDTPNPASSEHENTSIEWLRFKAGSTTQAYLDVYAFAGSGAYSLTYGSTSKEATISSIAPATCNWNGPATIKGAIHATDGGAAVEGIKVYLLKKSGSKTYSKLAEASTDTTGNYVFTVKPQVATTYQIVAMGSSTYAVTNTPKAFSIKPRAYVSVPVVRNPMLRWHSYSISGYLKPYDTRAQSVKIRCYRWDGKAYVWKKTVVATNYKVDSVTRKYKGYLSLAPGKWHIKAYVSGTSSFGEAWSSGYAYRYVR